MQSYNQQITPRNLPRLIQFLEALFTIRSKQNRIAEALEAGNKLDYLYELQAENEISGEMVRMENAKEYDKYDYV